MLLTGTYTRTLDEKNRVAIPSKIRDLILAEEAQISGLYVAPGQDGCIALFPPSQINRLAEQLDKAAYTGRDVRRFRRLYFSQSEISEWDKQGRILIPEKLLVRAEIPAEKKPREVILAGVQRHLEVWEPERWQRFCAESEAQFDMIAEGALDRAAGAVQQLGGS